VIIIFCTVPTEPRNVSITRVVNSPTQLHVQWKEPEDHNGIIQEYTVYCRTNTIPETGVIVIYQVVLATQIETLVDKLTPFTVYECYATANTSAGEGNPSVALTAVTDESSRLNERRNFRSSCNSHTHTLTHTHAHTRTAPHDAPTYFSGLTLNSTAFFLSWSSPTLPYGIIIS